MGEYYDWMNIIKDYLSKVLDDIYIKVGMIGA